jgi:hypothetical protein
MKAGITEKFTFTFFVYVTDFIKVLLVFTIRNSRLFYSTKKSCFAIVCVLFVVSLIFFSVFCILILWEIPEAVW